VRINIILTQEAVSNQDSLVQHALEKKALRATLWSVLEYGSGIGLRMVSSLVLTRLLLPAYFGEITLVMTLIVGITLLTDVGLGPSVIQSARGDDPDFLNTAWTIQLIRGTILWLVAVAISHPMAIFYHDPRLKLLLPILSLSVLISGFNSTNLLTLSRHLGVKRLFAIDGSTAVISLIVTLVWAYYWPSVWAIVAGQLVSTLYRLVLSHIPSITPGIRNSFCWDRSSIHSIIHFGKWIMIGTAFFFFGVQADRLILGKLVGFTLLGIYGIAYQISDVPRAVISALGSKVLYPLVSKMMHLPMSEFRQKFLRYRFYILLAGSCLLSLMVTWGDLLVLKLYDHRYHEAAWMIRILALGLWQTILYQTTFPVLLSMGKSKYSAMCNGPYCISMLVGIPLAFHFFGMTGAVIAVAAGDFPFYLINQIGATRAGIRPFRQDLQMTAVFISMLLVLFCLKRLLLSFV
jgi:O-antigen/teichoic acid export membrane protein